MGLPPTPESLGLDDELYDAYLDELAPWDRNRLLVQESPKSTRRPWWKVVLWLIIFPPSLVLAIFGTFAVPIAAFLFIPAAIPVWLITFLPLGYCISCVVK